LKRIFGAGCNSRPAVMLSSFKFSVLSFDLA
jgi:hypothetical protein